MRKLSLLLTKKAALAVLLFGTAKAACMNGVTYFPLQARYPFGREMPTVTVLA